MILLLEPNPQLADYLQRTFLDLLQYEISRTNLTPLLRAKFEEILQGGLIHYQNLQSAVDNFWEHRFSLILTAYDTGTQKVQVSWKPDESDIPNVMQLHNGGNFVQFLGRSEIYHQSALPYIPIGLATYRLEQVLFTQVTPCLLTSRKHNIDRNLMMNLKTMIAQLLGMQKSKPEKSSKPFIVTTKLLDN